MTSDCIGYIQDVLITIHQNLHELQGRKAWADSEELNHIEGKIQAYQELIAMLKASAKEFRIPAVEIGI